MLKILGEPNQTCLRAKFHPQAAFADHGCTHKHTHKDHTYTDMHTNKKSLVHSLLDAPEDIDMYKDTQTDTNMI